MTFRTKWMALLPAFLLIAYCGYRLTEDAAHTAARVRTAGEDVSLWNDLFSRLGKKIEGVESVGFVCGEDPRLSVSSDRFYFIAQYALAPVRVYPSLHHRYVVGYFPSLQGQKDFLRRTKLKVLADYYDGMVLLENEGGP